MNLTQKYDVKTLEDVLGQDKTVSAIRKYQKKEREWPQVFYFEGLTGTGKTSLSNIVGQSKVCENLDENGQPCLECRPCKDISNNTYSYGTAKRWNAREVKLNIVEEIKELCSKQSMFTDHIVIFIDEVQYLLPATIEELHTIIEKDYHGTRTFIFSAMEKNNMARSLGSRTAKFALLDIPQIVIGKRLIEITQAEGIKVDSTQKVEILTAISEFANGSMRDGIHYLQTVIDKDIWEPKDLAKELGIVTNESLLNMCGQLIEGDYKVFEYEWNPDTLTSARRMLFNVYKIQKGIELPSYIAKQTGSLSKLSMNKVRFALNKMIESLALPYLNKEVVELTVLDILDHNSQEKGPKQSLNNGASEIPKVRQRVRT